MAFNNGKYMIDLKIQLENTAPFNIGDDEGMPIITLEEGEVYLPGTTLAGAFRDYLNNCGEEGIEEDFGEDREKSKIFFMDSYCPLKSFEKRAAASIDKETSTSNNKFSRVYVSTKHKFNVNIKIWGDSKEDLEDRYRKVISCLIAINKEEILLGAYKSSGAGSFKVNEVLKEEYSFENKEDIFSYLLKEKKGKRVDLNKLRRTKTEEILFEFKLKGRLKTSILVKGEEKIYGEESCATVYINGEGEYIIPGTSLKGVIRAESERILKYLGYDSEESINIFGGKKEEENIASNFRIKDSTIEDVRSKICKRIKMDKFTGRTQVGALFNEEVFSGAVTIKGSLRTEDYKYVGLIAMVLRDIALGKISLGSGNNVGRGRIRGKELIISQGEKTILKWNFDNSKVEVNEIDSFINKLVGREN
ncbi:RAMP superfamily CRISPR-associated protein [Clostridium perfringens]|nr:RAMP superfamily CRISPR-associated protein [Clostridium perfringens]MDK0602165.1 RAMP superfamily CRISPR-associated protein [Clostridium perfringens]